MKLNFHILADSLREHQPNLITTDSIKRNLINVRLLPDEPEKCRESYVYVSTHGSLEKYLQLASLSLIIVGKSDQELNINNDWQLMMLETTADVWTVYEALQSVFDTYNQWDDQLKDAILSGDALQRQLDICSAVLTNPIALLDMSFIMIARSGQFPDKFDDPIWETVLNKGYSSVENIPRQYRNLLEQTIAAGKPLLLPALDEPNAHRIICATLVQKKIPFANLAMTNLCNEFTLGQLSLVYHIQQLLEVSLQLPKSSINLSNDICYLISKLIHGDAVDATLKEHFFYKKNWLKEDSLFLIVFEPKDEIGLIDINHMAYINHIRDALPHSYTMYIDHKIISICLSKYNMHSQNEIASQIMPLLERLELVAGISMEEPGYEFLQNAMLQGKIALQIGKKKELNQNFFTFQEVHTDFVIMALEENQNIQTFCHPFIQKILRYPDPWSLELLQTLWVYLQNGRRISATAEKLFIHRNTLINRLQQIEKIFGIDFEKITDTELDLLLISCYIAKSIMPFQLKEDSDAKQ